MAVLRNGPTHGYGIAKEIREKSGTALKLGEGQLYPILHELEETGCVTAEWEMQNGDPPRRVYALTEKGGKELAQRTKQWRDFTSAVGSILTAPEGRLESQP